MSAAVRAGGSLTAWRVLVLSQVREQPGRLAITVIAIALGVSLGAAVYLVNTAALNEFGLGMKRLVGEADIVVRGPREGFSEQLFTKLAREPAVSVASPVLELEVALPGRRDTLKVLGLDPFRAAALQPSLIADIAGGVFDLFEPDALFLSNSAAEQLHLQRGDTLKVIIGSSPKSLHIAGVLAEGTYPQALGVMDIASAQWTFEKLGRLNRIDLRLRPGSDVEALRVATRPPTAGRRSCGRAASGTRPRGDCHARVPRQPEHAGAGRAVDRRFSGLLHSILVGPAQAKVSRSASGARRDSR